MCRLLLCAALVCALIGAVSAGGARTGMGAAHAVATVDEESAEAIAMQLDKKIYDFLRMLRVEELLDEMKHSLSLNDDLAKALSQRWSAAFPQFLRRVQELCLKGGSAYEYLFPKISELWEDYTQDVGVLLQKAIDEQFNELAAAKGITVRPPERPTDTERSAAKRTVVFFNKLADMLNEEVSAALDALVNGKSVTYARSLVLSFIGVLDQVENLHGTPECKRWLTEFLAAANASVWASARSTEGRMLTVDIRDARSIAIAALDDTVLGKTLQSWRLYWWFKRHYWWRGSVTPSRHEPDMERMATTLVADRFVVALHEAEAEITGAVLKILDHTWKATWSLEMKVFSPVVTLVNPDSVSFFSPLDPEPMLKGNITSLARVPCLEAWVEQSAQFYNTSCGNLRHAKRARYWFSSHSLASTGLLVAVLLLVISTLLCLSPCFCCCLCCYGCYKTPLLMLGLLGAAMAWLIFSIGRILLS